ncbi:hypothetical protein [Nocardioides litoris]|uniref:hypothetical protein n=1 Tax=Nocardioides litoris TaxID=1926648 RepID=UPI001122629C|nr:hypothetical protein [Nocardioides litoris]
MSAPAVPGRTFTDTDLDYVRCALRESLDSRRAHVVVEATAYAPGLREAAHRVRTASEVDADRTLALLEAWGERWAAPAGRPSLAEGLLGVLAAAPATRPGREQDRRLVVALTAYVEAVVRHDRAQMVAGRDPAARGLAEDHLQAAARYLRALRDLRVVGELDR